MTKFYKNIKTGAVITEKEYEQKIIQSEEETSSGLGSMSMGGYSNFMNNFLDGEMEDFSDYVPYTPEKDTLN